MGRVEIFQGRARRRWSEEDKRRLVAEAFMPGETVHGVARRRGVSPSQLFGWRKLFGAETGPGVPAARVSGFAAVEIAPAPATPPAVADAVPAPSGLIEIELAGGDRVRISGAADPAVVMAALRALAGR
jgi:transposase